MMPAGRNAEERQFQGREGETGGNERGGGGANQKLALEQWFLITKINAYNYTHIRLGMYVCVLYKTPTHHITYMCLAVF